jgi:hypothetical protein
MKIQKLVEMASAMTDSRRQYGNKRHKLVDIIVIGLCTVLCKGEDFSDMEDFGNEREEWLRAFLELPNGIPDSDTFRRVYERINPAELSVVLYDLRKTALALLNGKIANISETISASGNTDEKKKKGLTRLSMQK